MALLDLYLTSLQHFWSVGIFYRASREYPHDMFGGGSLELIT